MQSQSQWHHLFPAAICQYTFRLQKQSRKLFVCTEKLLLTWLMGMNYCFDAHFFMLGKSCIRFWLTLYAPSRSKCTTSSRSQRIVQLCIKCIYVLYVTYSTSILFQWYITLSKYYENKTCEGKNLPYYLYLLVHFYSLSNNDVKNMTWLN